MNQLHIVRLLIPSLKIGYKKLQPQEKGIDYLLKNYQKPNPRSLLNEHDPLIGNMFSLPPLEPCIRAVTETTAEEDEEMGVDDESWPFREPKFTLHKNLIQNRIKFVQYEANNPCQDSLIFEQLKHIDAYTVSIFDGHGGPDLAQYSKSTINTFINKYLQEHLNNNQDDVGKILRDSLVWSYQQLEDKFFDIYQQHLKIGNSKIRSVGTCGITAIVHNDRVYLGNAGDSQAIFILSEGKSLMRTQKANERLSVNNKEERQRLLEQWKGVDDQIISEESSHCYYLKGRLQPTRSIGDYYLKKEEYYVGEGTFKGPYLSCSPDVNEFTLTSAHRYLVLASDGLWDVLSRNEVMSTLMNGREIDLSKTCYEQGEESPYIGHTLECVLQKCADMVGCQVQQLKQIPKGKRRNYHDDITIAIVDLGFQL